MGEIEPEKVEKTITIMETNEAGEQVEVEKKVKEDVKYPPWYTKSFWDPIVSGKEQREAFYAMMTAPNGAPILTKSGLNSYKRKEIRRMNDGEVAFFDRDDPNCPPNT